MAAPMHFEPKLAPPAPPPWTQAEEAQLTALTARKLLVDTHRRLAVLTVVEEFHHRNITTDEVTAELISLAPRVIKALVPYAPLPPLDMVLYCPNCGLQHVEAPETCPDEGCPHYGTPHSHPSDWLNPPHRSHLCHECGCIWRPADVPTNGVERLQTTGKADTWGGTRPEDRRRRAFHQPTASTRNDNER